jgi:hypothetical protein
VILNLPLMLWGGLADAAFAGGTARTPEEITIYGDDFARWDHTRWLVAAELILPLGVGFAAEEDEAFVSYAFQVRAIVACEKDGRETKNVWEVSCTVEDVGLLVSAYRRAERERDRELVQRVLDQIDAKLTGMDVQMQVDRNGGITDVDLEGVTTDNERDRGIQESLRQVMGRVMAGFHLRIPDHAQRDGQWIETHSELMDLPSLTASRGSTMLVHVVSPYAGARLVQTIGQGTTAVHMIVQDKGGQAGSPFEQVSNADAALLSVSGAETELEMMYDMSATGVAMFDQETGIMTERVWAVHGIPTASGDVFSGPPYRNVGRLALLGQADRPDVGPSKQVAPPGAVLEGLDRWVDIEAHAR